jgi:hypothetical protein
MPSGSRNSLSTNPYSAPQLEEPGAVGPWRPGAHATLVARGLLYRRLAVTAPLEMTLEFHGRSLLDRVLVNGREVARQTSWWRIAPRLSFTLASDDGSVPGLVEIRVWPWLALRGFRVTVGGRVVYTEGKLAAPAAGAQSSGPDP